MRLIVVEGPDGSGKTTLVDSLRTYSKRHHLVIRRSGPPNDAQILTDTISWMNRAAYAGLTIVCDRHPIISEPIYGTALRGKNLLEDVFNVDDLKNIFQDSVNRVIYCRPSDEVLARYVGHQPQLKGVIDRHGEIIRAYDFLMQMIEKDWGVPVLRYDWQNPQNLSHDDLFFGEP